MCYTLGRRDKLKKLKENEMITQKEAIDAIKKATIVFIITRLTEHDMAYMKGIKSDVIREINIMALAGTKEFNVTVCDDGDVVIG